MAARLVGVLLVAFAASLGGVNAVATAFQRIESGLLDMSGVHLPAVSLAAQLVWESRRLAGLGADALLARSDAMRDELRWVLASIETEKGRVVEELRGLGLPRLGLNAAERNFGELTGKLAGLIDLGKQEAEGERKLAELAGRLEYLSAELARLPVGRSDCAARWHIQVYAAIVDLLASLAARNDGQIQRLRDSFALHARSMTIAADCAALHAGAEAARLTREVRELGANAGMFDQRSRLIQLRYAQEDQLARERYLGDALLGAVDPIFTRATDEIGRQIREAGKVAEASLILLGALSVFLLLMAFAAYGYLHRACLRPLLRLQRAIGDSLAYRKADFPPDGPDEIGVIVSAVRGYVETLARREEDLRRANLAKTYFLAGVSHELRTPLNAILGNAQLLDQGNLLDTRAQAYLDRINRNGSELLRLIENLLDASALESGRMPIHVREFELSLLIRDLEAMIRPEAEAKGLSFTCEFPDDLPRVIQADGQRLRQVLLNLLGNAVKFTESGLVELICRLDETEDGRLLLFFAVTDTGPGIPQTARDAVFEPFARIDPGKPGFGLGLAIARDLVVRMGGELILESTVGQGSRFSFSIPIHAPDVSIQSEILADEPAPPPLIELETALELAQLRRLDQVLDWCDDLAAGSPRHADFAARVRTLAASGDDRRLAEWLEKRCQP